MAISQIMLKQLIALIASGQEYRFYSWSCWQHTREEVLKLDHYECKRCKANGRYRRAVLVHHVKHLKDRPDLALSIWDGEERQLISVCKRCHEELHPESQRQHTTMAKPVTEERWD